MKKLQSRISIMTVMAMMISLIGVFMLSGTIVQASGRNAALVSAAPLDDQTLNGATLEIQLAGDTFQYDPGNPETLNETIFTVQDSTADGPDGLNIASAVQNVDHTVATITLQYAGGPEKVNDLWITIEGDGLLSGDSLTTNAIDIAQASTSLKSILVDTHSLASAFSPTEYNYTVDVPYGTTSVSFSVEPYSTSESTVYIGSTVVTDTDGDGLIGPINESLDSDHETEIAITVEDTDTADSNTYYIDVHELGNIATSFTLKDAATNLLVDTAQIELYYGESMAVPTATGMSANGLAAIAGLHRGEYYVKISKAGYNTILKPIYIDGSLNKDFSFKLIPSMYPMELEFTDTNDEQNQITGSLQWEFQNQSYSYEKFRFYFEDADNTKLGAAIAPDAMLQPNSDEPLDYSVSLSDADATGAVKITMYTVDGAGVETRTPVSVHMFDKVMDSGLNYNKRIVNYELFIDYDEDLNQYDADIEFESAEVETGAKFYVVYYENAGTRIIGKTEITSGAPSSYTIHLPTDLPQSEQYYIAMADEDLKTTNVSVPVLMVDNIMNSSESILIDPMNTDAESNYNLGKIFWVDNKSSVATQIYLYNMDTDEQLPLFDIDQLEGWNDGGVYRYSLDLLGHEFDYTHVAIYDKEEQGLPLVIELPMPGIPAITVHPLGDGASPYQLPAMGTAELIFSQNLTGWSRDEVEQTIIEAANSVLGNPTVDSLWFNWPDDRTLQITSPSTSQLVINKDVIVEEVASYSDAQGLYLILINTDVNTSKYITRVSSPIYLSRYEAKLQDVPANLTASQLLTKITHSGVSAEIVNSLNTAVSGSTTVTSDMKVRITAEDGSTKLYTIYTVSSAANVTKTKYGSIQGVEIRYLASDINAIDFMNYLELSPHATAELFEVVSNTECPVSLDLSTKLREEMFIRVTAEDGITKKDYAITMLLNPNGGIGGSDGKLELNELIQFMQTNTDITGDGVFNKDDLLILIKQIPSLLTPIPLV